MSPLLAAIANTVSFVGAPFSASELPHQCQDPPPKLSQRSQQNTSHRWPWLQLCYGQAEAAWQGGKADPSDPLAGSTA